MRKSVVNRVYRPAGPSDLNSEAQQRDGHAGCQAHSRHRFWPAKALRLVSLVVVAFLAFYAVGEEAPGEPLVLLRVQSTVTRHEANQRKGKPRT